MIEIEKLIFNYIINKKILDKLNNNCFLKIKNLLSSNYYVNLNNNKFLLASYSKRKNLYNNIFKIEYVIQKKYIWILTKIKPFSIKEKKFFLLLKNKTNNLFFEKLYYNYKFFQNKSCKFFPCHEIKNIDKFNCLFCYCPLYNKLNCNGKYSILDNSIKNCSKCLLPHIKEKYNYIIKQLTLNI